MGRLLDENNVIDALEKVASFFPYRIPGKGETYDKYNEAWNDAIGRAEIEIKQLPSAQPEREKSEWIEEDYVTKIKIRCKKCGEYTRGVYRSKFCPNCGRYMWGKNNGKTT